MKSIDDYKMVLHNSAIVINNCEQNDFPTLTSKFRVYDPVCHRSNIVGIHYDPINKRMYFPRGLDVDYLRRKIESTMEIDEFSSMVIHHHPYDYVPNKIRMLYQPKDDVQMQTLKFITCKDQYKNNYGKSQFSINLNTGKGKTYIASCAISYFGVKTMIITTQSGILDQWRDRLLEYTNIDKNDIVKLEGGPVISRIINDSSAITNKAVYLCTHSTIQSYASQFGWDKISVLFDKLKIGIKIFDEAHQNFQNMALIDFFARDVWKTYYLTATPSRSDRQEDMIYKLYMKNIPSIDLFNPNVDPHTNYIAIKYNSSPKPADINSCKTSVYGLSNPAYIDYLMRNERFWIMFDYIFSLIYRNGGKALFYIGTNSGIEKVYQRIMFNYPELVNDVGIYSSINTDKQSAKSKMYILTTTKSAGAGEDIADLKYSVVLAEPFKSEILARQTLGRTRNPNTSYIELVDVGFKQIVGYFNSKKPIFQKYASGTKIMNVDNPKIANLSEETRLNIRNRFRQAVVLNQPKKQEAIIQLNTDKIPAVYFGSNSLNRTIDE